MSTILYSIWGIRKLILIVQEFFINLLLAHKIGNRISILGIPIISIHKGAKVKFGKNIMLISHSYFSQPGVNHPVIIRALTKESQLTIGNDVGISGGGICVMKEVIIGNNVMLGANAFITDTDFHPIAPQNRRYNYEDIQSRKVVIEDNVFIGMNSVVLKGVTIGENSVIGAGSIVAKDVPPNQIWAGSPAKFIKNL
ncbi:acyltransferase [Rhodocytophaga rosea]|uniref:Acyltransferase n=1 Tax=Rhodocytophaga rosea TaxID=2704465 RepID=A0A6C0GQF9_9BACT|nr:acyltransferase [Rhodocytophaga rosea]QHT69802.1 acyltransferase [Rhodocytophaga rosea]